MAHNQKVAGSNPAPTTKFFLVYFLDLNLAFDLALALSLAFFVLDLALEEGFLDLERDASDCLAASLMK